jgi:lysophospholipase L1-like esterase
MLGKITDLKRDRKREWLLRAFIGSVSLLLTLTAMEVALRLAWPQIFPPHPPGMYSPDEDIGYVLTPGLEVEFRGAEYRVSARINESGLRGKDLRALEKDSVRILCLGDSFTWGWGTNDDEGYPAVLERLLQSRYPLLDVQVLNAGVAGYGTDEELEFLRKRGRQLRPNLVLPLFFAGNDFEDNRLPATRSHEIRDGMLYIVRQPGEQRKPIWLALPEWLRKKSHLANLISERAGYLAMRAGLLAKLERRSSQYFSEEDGRRARDLLIEIAQVAEQLDAETLFVFAPDKLQLLTKPKNTLRAATVVQAAASVAGAPWIDLTPELVERVDFDELYFVRDGHWTPKGNAWVAEVLTERIGDLGLLRARE